MINTLIAFFCRINVIIKCLNYHLYLKYVAVHDFYVSQPYSSTKVLYFCKQVKEAR